MSSKSFDGSWNSYHSIIEHLLATVVALMDTFISSRPWSLRWSTCVLVFASVDSWITWFTSSWKERNCYVKLSNYFHSKWQFCSPKTILSVTLWICSVLQNSYCSSANSFRRNCSFLNLILCTVVTMRKLFKGWNYMREYGMLFSAWDKSCDPGANWSKLEHM